MDHPDLNSHEPYSHGSFVTSTCFARVTYGKYSFPTCHSHELPISHVINLGTYISINCSDGIQGIRHMAYNVYITLMKMSVILHQGVSLISASSVSAANSCPRWGLVLEEIDEVILGDKVAVEPCSENNGIASGGIREGMAAVSHRESAMAERSTSTKDAGELR